MSIFQEEDLICSSKLNVLFVDDDLINVETFAVSFQEEYNILTATSGEEGLKVFYNAENISMVISDQRMPGMSGVDLLTQIYATNPETIRIIITGYMDVTDIIDSINMGHIYQYILKPWDINQLRLVLNKAAHTWKLARENKILTKKLNEKNQLLKKVNKSLSISEGRLRHLANVLINAQENERKRIAMELHDELGQSLAAVKMQIKVIENQLEKNVPTSGEIKDKLEILRQFLNEIIENVRRLSKDLSPVIIDDLGLDAAIDNLVENFSRYNDIKCTYKTVRIADFFDPEAHRLIYRLIQESLNNVRRHSGATNLYIDIKLKDEFLSIQIRDNGKGFNIQEVMNRSVTNRGIGLSAMTERGNMLGGMVDIGSQPGGGTTVLITLPFSKKDRTEL